MSTQKPLVDMIPEIIKHYNEYVEYLEMNRRLYNIREGQILEEVKQSLRKEIASQTTYQRVCERIPSINILKKVTEKLSKVYLEDPIRRCDSATDQEILDRISSISNLDNSMKVANEFYNMQRMFAVEPFVREGRQQFRVLGGHQFLPYSDDPADPTNMTVFIKLLGNDIVNVPSRYDEDGIKKTTEDEIQQVTVLGLYTDTEFLIIDTGGGIRRDRMRDMGVEIDDEQVTSPNPYGVIPFYYGKESQTELIPYPNAEGLNMSVLVPKLYSDLNYAAQFLSHSIIWVKNSDLTGQAAEPDTIINLGERTEENGEPEMGVISPTIDIPNVLEMISSQVNAYLSSLGIKTTPMNNNSSNVSGVARAIDEADTTNVRKHQVEYFREVEMGLWDLVSRMQDVWVNAGILTEENRKLSSSFLDNLSIIFAEMKPIKSMRQKIEEVQLLRQEKLISKRRALKKLMPELSEKQIEEWSDEIEDEAQEALDRMIGRGEMPSLGPGRNPDGTFASSNTESQEQDPETNMNAREE